MSEQPTVCAICLTKDRPEMLARAVRSFQAQTYENKSMLVYDTSSKRESRAVGANCITIWSDGDRGKSVGRLRNAANANADGWGVWHLGSPQFTPPDIFCHFDDDDISHPNRIAEQVALLQTSRADVVGYSNLLFWREAEDEAWLYTAHGAHFAPGTSLCYWRKTWERKPFPDISNGEDNAWLLGLKIERAQSISNDYPSYPPRLIASIHAGNTSPSYQQLLAIDCKQRDHYFRRVPEYDQVCREAMAL